VAIGASAGGLDACRKLVAGLPRDGSMACILIQHLEPNHESLMVDLLADHTALTVRQAAEGMLIEPDRLYVIPPGTYLSVRNGALHVSQPQAPHGARMPFDFLLHSLAEEYGARTVCVVLSGTGADGTDGLVAVKERSGLVIAQDPEEAEYDGMPGSAIATGLVDLILPAARIPDAIAGRELPSPPTAGTGGTAPIRGSPDWLAEIVDLLRSRTPHDFSLYKPGTLQRRIERRMGMVAIGADHPDRYIHMLKHQPEELGLLAKDLLINVTSFFRDPDVFALLEEKIVPEMLHSLAEDHVLRIWIAGCSSGEETYSLAMIFREQIEAAKLNIRLQVFASDIDPEAVASAREGVYAKAIEADVSAERLARFFVKEEHGYRVTSDLRSAVVFTVQDVLADPPFSRLDLVSCRNLLIYLLPEAQAKVLSLFHFALREGGILLLGSSETVGGIEGRFEAISKSARVYRHIGRSRPGELGLLMNKGGARLPSQAGRIPKRAREVELAELCRQKVIEAFAPAAVLINAKNQCLYSLGPVDRYLRVAPGYPTDDLLAMAPAALGIKLRAAIQLATDGNKRVEVVGGQSESDGRAGPFNLDVQPVSSDGERLLLVCFVDTPGRVARSARVSAPELPRVAELERELDATRSELQGAIRNLEASGEEQRAINEEALSVNEEYQSTNEELLTSKEELQSLNEELTALNAQLQETLERQRTTSNDLQNVLYSTNVATIFLDPNLKIRFFTPATKALFSVIPGDVGRPLADLNSLASDVTLLTDASMVLRALVPIEREIEADDGAWYVRRVMPYRTGDGGVEGVVVTFVDVTVRKHTAEAVEAAEQRAVEANAAKSRFLAAASHDLRQPLQALNLMRGVLERKIKSGKTDEALSLVARLNDTAASMTGLLNTMLDINQIEAGIVKPEPSRFSIAVLLNRLRDEFTYHATAKGLELRAVACRLAIETDPRLLEQMLRNLLANALKYTKHGKILLGCRRHGDKLSIEVVDTGAGIPEPELDSIFEEYRQLDNAHHERSRGLGLGLSIVKRLAGLMDLQISVRSKPGKGSIFAIEVPLALSPAAPGFPQPGSADKSDGVHRTGTILVVDDDPEVLDLLALTLREDGHRVITAPDGPAALELAVHGKDRPDIILTDYDLPFEMNGLDLGRKLRLKLRRDVPITILTGDITTETLREIARSDCVQLNKPIDLEELVATIAGLLAPQEPVAPAPAPDGTEASGGEMPVTVFVVDDDPDVLKATRATLEEGGRVVETFSSCEAFLSAYHPTEEVCLLIDAHLPGMSGLDLLRHLAKSSRLPPAIMITGVGDVPTAVAAMKAGALDFIEKPVSMEALLEGVGQAIEHGRDVGKRVAWREAATKLLGALTPRERQIMDLVLAGIANKNIAADLHISQRTVENHRASVMKKTGSKSLPALARLAVAASGNPT
jgi:two-component system CheB/CheR fusion protein